VQTDVYESKFIFIIYGFFVSRERFAKNIRYYYRVYIEWFLLLESVLIHSNFYSHCRHFFFLHFVRFDLSLSVSFLLLHATVCDILIVWNIREFGSPSILHDKIKISKK
jgi:hypothetical protein